jgi:triosephosphate isomerase (TIM)
MRKPFIAGNWKMFKTVEEAKLFVAQVRDELDALTGQVDVAFCVPFVSLTAVFEAVQGTNLGVGAQNMYWEESGAYTGEISPLMLKPYCQYVILGHSERRAYFGETDEGVNKKAKVALAHGLTPSICVGESLEQNEAGETVPFVSGQVAAALAGMTAEQVGQLVIAYEPIWAIGTGKSASAEMADGIIYTAVRQPIAQLFGEETAEKVRIQYGGSVNPANISAYMAMPNIDGALVGGASLKPDFIGLVQGGA